MKNKNMFLMFISITMFSITCNSQFSNLEKPAANLTEKWDTNSSGWVSNDILSGWTNGAIEIKCQFQTLGDGLGKLFCYMATNEASNGIFFGNYSKIESASFDFQPYDMTVSPSFYFKSAVSGIQWSLPFLSLNDGQKTNMAISMIYSTNWLGYRGDDASIQFNNDKTNIYEVGFEFYRGPNDLKEQKFAIDNMKLNGSWGGPFSNGVSLAWVIENGLTNSNFGLIGSLDSDNDGCNNVAEFLAGTNPNDSNSVFRINIARNNIGQIVVKWNSNRDVNYELRESNNLLNNRSFTSYTNITSLSIGVEEIVVNQSNDFSKFYKVLITPIK